MHRLPLLLLAAAFGAGFATAAEIRIEGGMVAARSFVAPHRAAVEARTGHVLKVSGTTGTKGLIALARGECELAVTAIPLDLMIIEAKAAGVDLREGDFVMHVMREDRMLFIVNPANPVRSLSAENLEAVYAGRITNWKQLGGANAPIAIFTDKVDSGTSALLRSRLLKGGDFGGDHSALSNLKFVADNVTVNQRAIGAISSAFLVPGEVKVLETEPMVRPMGFVSKGAPGEEVRVVIEAYRGLLEK